MGGISGNPFCCSFFTGNVTPVYVTHPATVIFDLTDLLHHTHTEHLSDIFKHDTDQPFRTLPRTSYHAPGDTDVLSQSRNANLDLHTNSYRPVK